MDDAAVVSNRNCIAVTVNDATLKVEKRDTIDDSTHFTHPHRADARYLFHIIGAKVSNPQP